MTRPCVVGCEMAPKKFYVQVLTSSTCEQDLPKTGSLRMQLRQDHKTKPSGKILGPQSYDCSHKRKQRKS